MGDNVQFLNAFRVSSFQIAFGFVFSLTTKLQKLQDFRQHRSDEHQSQFLISDTTDFHVHLQAPNMTINMSAKTNCNFYKINLGSMSF